MGLGSCYTISGMFTANSGEDCSVDATYVGSGAAGVFFRA